MATHLDRIIARRTRRRYDTAVKLAAEALTRLERSGFDAVVIGSLATGRFRAESVRTLFSTRISKTNRKGPFTMPGSMHPIFAVLNTKIGKAEAELRSGATLAEGTSGGAASRPVATGWPPRLTSRTASPNSVTRILDQNK